MKSHQRLLLFLILILLLTSVLSPWFALAADQLAAQWPEVFSRRYPFSRVFNRTYMVAGIILFFAFRRLLGIPRLSELGLVGWREGWGDLVIGWLLAVASLAALLAVMSLGQVFDPFFRLPLAESLSRCASALLAGAGAGFFEELFFRGILFQGLLEEGKPLRAYLLANLFYSVVHFVKPGEPYFLEPFDPWGGFYHLLYTFTPFLDPLPLLPGIFGLFLLGVALSYAFARSGNLYLPIGLHAGWVFALKTTRVFGDYRREDLGWLFGSSDPKIVSGALAWVGILLVCLAVYYITRDRRGLRPHSGRRSRH